MTDTIRKIGFIGLGSMGGDQARELAKLPLDLTVYDVFPEALAKFEGRAKLAASMAEVGEDADAVGICVRDDTQVLECVDALLPAMKRGAILLIHSTIKPKTAQHIAERAAPLGIDVIDAPVTRTEMSKDGPFVFCMTGGEESVAARVQVVLNAFSTNTMHIGPLGSAMALKICNNLVSWCGIMLGIEVANVAEASGVPMDKLLTVMKRNGNLTPPMAGFVDFRNNPGDAARRAFFASQAGIGEKDLALAEELAAGADAVSPITSHTKTLLKKTLLAICES
ncbi:MULTISPECIES: NAD(P)-dependent oxidoreductase [Sphingobium]|uniref:NAD(P)-dependent oxidoreductase n=1 Tax=Sphingobium TaxID=165695 RepID=UPI00077029E4|nr:MULTISPECIES: NAD(P)-binding domain-containing protein [unclassified Sphingobium]AMK25635.1 6-phosphogluconate dehydrogenase [Sphingobium sp. TKS]MEC6700716.1 NAD(P)-binding domain-containing protein [Sphingobium sp. SJ10-10]NML87891.1 NAD(P)-dependent oxidoreductase [Sphingobium sp. TB-6]PNQ04482.1 oxidoreductase [Sphingobium sp. SA916]